MMTVTSPPSARRSYRYYDLVCAGFVAVLLCSNLIGPGKSCVLDLPFELPLIGAALVFGAGNIFFPISYIFGDILTEVYGYAKARRVIWAGFGALIFATVMSNVVIALPANPKEPFNEAYVPAVELVFGNTWRIVAASMLAFWVGDFLNSYVMARMKVWSGGRRLWMRTIGSTFVGQGVDSLIFYPLAFASLAPVGEALGVKLPASLAGGWSGETVLAAVLFNWGFKVAVEVVMTPVTYAVVGWLKRAENEDYYDRGTDFTPFSLKD